MYSILPGILQRLIWIPTRLSFLFFFHLKIQGQDNLKGTKGGAIFALNHTSELDAIVLPASLGIFLSHIPMFYLSRTSEFYKNSGWRRLFYGGTFFKMWGAYPVNTHDKDYETALKTHIAILKDGHSLCVFPEGSVSKDGTIRRGHGGVSYLAWKTGCTVIPVGVSGLWRTSFNDFILRKRHATITFGKPVRIAELQSSFEKAEDFGNASQCVMNRIASLVTKQPVA